MPTVYRIVPAVDEFQYVLADNSKDLAKYAFDGTPVADKWEPPKCYVPFPTRPEADFWGCFLRNDLFAAARHTADIVGTFVDQSCEALPLPLSDRELMIFNVTHVLNCLHTENSQYDPELPHIIDVYAFHEARFTHSLFKIPQTRMSEVLCVEGLASPDDEFKGVVKSHGLTGLRFEEIWSSR